MRLKTMMISVKALLGISISVAASQFSLHAQNPSAAEVIDKVNQEEQRREDRLASYSVLENYQIFASGDDVPVARATYQVEYVRGRGKEYLSVGTPEFRKPLVKRALQRITEGQERASRSPLRAEVLFTSSNYAMTLLSTPPAPNYICDNPDRVSLSGAYAIQLRPLQPRGELIDGVMWVDARTFRMIRVEGRFSSSPQMFVGKPLFERDYKDIEGFAMATESCQKADAMFVHHTSKISYSSYKLTQ